MWCVGRITQEYRERMYNLLDLYAKPYDAKEPVVCVDEKSKQLLEQTRPIIPGGCGRILKEDYEYLRAGTANIFVAVEPRAGHRELQVTPQRTKPEFVAFVEYLAESVYRTARRIHLVLDNLNIHFPAAFVDVLGTRKASRLLRRLVFHHTPKHASWLNMAELEIGILHRQCIRGRIGTLPALAANVASWQVHRNAERTCIDWRFTRKDADRKLARHYVA